MKNLLLIFRGPIKKLLIVIQKKKQNLKCILIAQKQSKYFRNTIIN